MGRERAQARQPKTCTACAGSGKCTACGGKGSFFALFLSASVGPDALLDFGRAQQGCQECGGYAQNIRGDLVQGSGKCLVCDGVGMVTPRVEEMPTDSRQMSTRLRRYRSSAFSTGLPILHSPKAVDRCLSGGFSS